MPSLLKHLNCLLKLCTIGKIKKFGVGGCIPQKIISKWGLCHSPFPRHNRVKMKSSVACKNSSYSFSTLLQILHTFLNLIISKSLSHKVIELAYQYIIFQAQRNCLKVGWDQYLNCNQCNNKSYLIRDLFSKVIRDKSQPSPYVPPGLWTLKICRKVYNAAKLWSTLSSTFAEKNCAPKLNFSEKLTDSLAQIMSLDSS